MAPCCLVWLQGLFQRKRHFPQEPGIWKLMLNQQPPQPTVLAQPSATSLAFTSCLWPGFGLHPLGLQIGHWTNPPCWAADWSIANREKPFPKVPYKWLPNQKTVHLDSWGHTAILAVTPASTSEAPWMVAGSNPRLSRVMSQWCQSWTPPSHPTTRDVGAHTQNYPPRAMVLTVCVCERESQRYNILFSVLI